MNKKIISILTAVIVLLGGGYVATNTLGSVGGLHSTVSTTTLQAVTANTVELLFATSTSCSSRVIGTQSGAIKLTFSDHNGARPTGLLGFPQAASTTVAYDSELYGCGAVYVYPFTSESLQVSETF